MSDTATLSEIAIECGVSVQAVRKLCAKRGYAKSGNRYQLTASQIAEIKAHYGFAEKETCETSKETSETIKETKETKTETWETNCETSETSKETYKETSETSQYEIIDLLKREIESLKEDKAYLQQQNEELTQTLKALAAANAATSVKAANALEAVPAKLPFTKRIKLFFSGN